MKLMAGAPLGNKNGAKGKTWRDAVRKGLIQYEDDDIKRGQALHRIATNIIRKAINGDKDSWQEIGNRMDGRQVQGLAIDLGADVELPDAITDEETTLILKALDEEF